MQRSVERILTTHVGSLPRPQRLLEMMLARESGGSVDPQQYDRELCKSVADTVRNQVECGLDVVNDGEMGKPGFIHYVNRRLSGFQPKIGKPLTGSYYAQSRDGLAFPEYYEAQSRMPGLAGTASNMESVRAPGRFGTRGMATFAAN